MSPSSRTDLIGSKALQPADTSPSRLLLIILNLLSYEKSVESPGQANSTLSCPALLCLIDRRPRARPPARLSDRQTDRSTQTVQGGIIVSKAAATTTPSTRRGFHPFPHRPTDRPTDRPYCYNSINYCAPVVEPTGFTRPGW